MTPKALIRLHEAACLARAYPRNRAELTAATRILSGFHERREVRGRNEELANSGIAGTPIYYRFFWPTARWLASRHASRLTIDWTEAEFSGRLAAALPLLLPPAEAEAVKRSELPPRKAIDRLRGSKETDACFVIRRIEALPGGDRIHEAIHDALDLAYRLEGSASGPSRTRAHLAGAPFAYRDRPPERVRPDLGEELKRPPRSVQELSVREGGRLRDLARSAMVTRSRDLDAFAYGDPRDAFLVDDGDGLAFGFIGVVPDRRLFLPAVYGALSLRNGVPIGYVQLDVLFGNAEVSFNTFETFRGGEAGFVFCRLLAATRHVFGVRSFSIEPYQLGRGNDEAIESGAWWFYARFGFRPRERATVRLARSEMAKRSRNPGYRSPAATLIKLAGAHAFFPPEERRSGAISPIAAIGFSLSGRRAKPSILGLVSLRGWTAAERLWLLRWSPLIGFLPGIARWTAAERRALVRIVRAKGGRRERDYARLFDAHPRLSKAVLTLARRRPSLG